VLVAAATTIWARRHVVRPIRVFAALAAAGAAAAVLAIAGIAIPGIFLVMTACLALAFAANRRPTAPASHPAVRRGAWAAAAVLMVAPVAASLRAAAEVGSGGIGAVSIGGGELLSGIPAIAIALGYIVRGLAADPADRLLAGALAGLVSPTFVLIALLAIGGFAALDTVAPGWVYPFAALAGAAVARANGNIRRP
jgi:hypothetical protein